MERRKMRSWVLPVAAGVCLIAPESAWAERFADEAAPELTAAFICNFARYTEWPDSSLGDSEKPFHVPVLGDDKIARAIDRLQAGAHNGRDIRARSLPLAEWDDRGQTLRAQLDGSYVLFVGSPYRAKASAILSILDRADVL